MIFWFSGTGNSLHAAKSLLEEGEELISIADCIRDHRYVFSIDKEESVGVVFPVYFGGLPQPVYRFLAHVSFTETPDYIWSVQTFGVNPWGAGHLAETVLGENGNYLDYSSAVHMPQNYILRFEIPSEEEQEKILADAEVTLAEIREQIRSRTEQIPDDSLGRAFTAVMYPAYIKGRKTAKFYTDEQCIRCGVCASRCPSGALVMQDGKPAWVKDRCIHCLACARCGAIQYGNSTIGKKRYTHPDLRKK